MTRNGEVKDDGLGNRLALVDHFLVVYFVPVLLTPPPCRSGIVPRLIRKIGGSRIRSSVSGVHLDIVMDTGNQAVRIGIRDILVGTIDEHTQGDMANPDVGVVVGAVFVEKGTKTMRDTNWLSAVSEVMLTCTVAMPIQ